MAARGDHEKFSSEHYRYEKLLGEGAAGRAILVSCRKENTQWVIKEIDLAELSPKERQDCLKEAKILEALSHPNIIKFREIYQTKQQKLHIVMEYADGGTLAALVKETARTKSLLSEERILACFGQLALAVRHLHERKIVHRDIKPENVFITSSGQIKLGDFGVATVLERTQSKLNKLIGTPYYLAPQILENRPYSLPADIWSLGVVLYEMLALTKPFQGSSLETLALKIVRGVYQDPPNHYGYGLRGILKKMLVVDPNSRPTIEKILKLRELAPLVKGHSVGEDPTTHSMLLQRVGKDDSDEVSSEEVTAPPTLQAAGKKESERQRNRHIPYQQQNIATDNIKTPQVRKCSVATRRASENPPKLNLQNLAGLLQIETPLVNRQYPKSQLPRLQQNRNNIFLADDLAAVDMTESLRQPADPFQNGLKPQMACRNPSVQRVIPLVLDRHPSVEKHNIRNGRVAIAVIQQKLKLDDNTAAVLPKHTNHKTRVKHNPKNAKPRRSVGNFHVEPTEVLMQVCPIEAIPNNKARYPTINEQLGESCSIPKLDSGSDSPPQDCSFEQIPLEESIPLRGTIKLSPSKLPKQPIRVNFSQVESLKIAFEEVFGVDNFIQLYKHLQNIVQACHEADQDTVLSQLRLRCSHVNRSLLEQHYGMLVTLLNCENPNY